LVDLTPGLKKIQKETIGLNKTMSDFEMNKIKKYEPYAFG
jgi:hypothetical protein